MFKLYYQIVFLEELAALFCLIFKLNLPANFNDNNQEFGIYLKSLTSKQRLTFKIEQQNFNLILKDLKSTNKNKNDDYEIIYFNVIQILIQMISRRICI